MQRLGLAFVLLVSAPAQAQLTPAEVYAAVARSAEVRADGSVEFHRPAFLHWRGNGVIGWGYDRDFREEKRAFLEETFDARLEMAARYRQKMARASVSELPARLCAIWLDPTRSIAERKEILHQLWDDAAEAEDPELGAHGRRARAIIEQFVAVMLPRGSPVAFADEELMAYARARFRAPAFNPYSPAAGMVEPLPAEPVHVDELEPDPLPVPSETVVAEVGRALTQPDTLRRMMLFVAWDDGAAEVDRAYVENALRSQQWSEEELRRYAALRGDEAFRFAAGR